MEKLLIIEKQLAEAYIGKWISHSSLDGEVEVRVSFGKNHKGLSSYRYWCGETRVERNTFQILTCPERSCPKQKELYSQWLVKTGQLPRVQPSIRQSPLKVAKLGTELIVHHGGEDVYAREAKLVTVITCPNSAHPPIEATRLAWDLFNMKGVFISTVETINIIEKKGNKNGNV
jgi:hypothetical protein